MFAVLDLNKGYYQFSVAKESRYLTAFVVPQGLFQFKRMPLGIATCTKEFTRVMDNMFKSLECVFSYLDDILIGGETKDICIERTLNVLQIIEEHGLTINFDKSVFVQEEIKFIGYLIGNGQITADLGPLNRLNLSTPPNNHKALSKIVHCLEWFRPVVTGLSGLLFPLTEKLRLREKFNWLPEDQSALDNTVTAVRR